MDAYKVLKQKLPHMLKEATRDNIYECLKALPLYYKKRALQAYMCENRRLCDDYKLTNKKCAPNKTKCSYRDYKCERILYKNRRDVCERLKLKRDQRCALAKVVKIPKGMEMHHVNRKIDRVQLLSKKKHIKTHKKERQRKIRQQEKRCAAKLFEF